jgi:hypothetical protein
VEIARRGTIRPANRSIPAKNFITVFTVVEEKAAQGESKEMRRRLLGYDKRDNSIFRLQTGVQLQLGHVADDLEDVDFECGTVRDGLGGFAGLRLLPEDSACFRFFDRAGNEWEMVSPPPGHSGLPELCHRVFATLGGHEDFAKIPLSTLTSQPCKVKPWIDDIRVAHAKVDTEVVAAFFERMSEATGVVWKPSSLVTGATVYPFLGLRWDHGSKVVSLGDKCVGKLQRARELLMQERLTNAELESLSGRLIYCTSALQIPLNLHYVEMRGIRLALWKARSLDDQVRMSPFIRRKIVAWIDTLLGRPKPFVRRRGPRQMWLYTDASLKGWGALLLSDDGRFWVVGGSWSVVHNSGDISALEAAAISRAIDILLPTLRVFAKGTLNIVVDNTAVQAAVGRGLARSFAVNAALFPALRTLYDIGLALTIRYIATEKNPVDSVLLPSEEQNHDRALWEHSSMHDPLYLSCLL